MRIQTLIQHPRITRFNLTQNETLFKIFSPWILEPKSTVTYFSNGADSGSVPVDGNTYSTGETVTVLGNTGNLVRAGYTFIGWSPST